MGVYKIQIIIFKMYDQSSTLFLIGNQFDLNRRKNWKGFEHLSELIKHVREASKKIFVLVFFHVFLSVC